ncbi:probable LRR receptor-like serine threonine-kinase At3g47570 [Olea europaea subsp. europaea]|uniref:Probable LRR receptor-like serine threonine-kinase At3g47570 n=1 Tax=Olea europaea subsp. europaea TaxID=158383 RepID=A0A8S0TYM1_OLEEU|nr:probable LRR receptor-like serine threonine-kinase At3g47570 [Olea europaea subsp. europaea]
MGVGGTIAKEIGELYFSRSLIIRNYNFLRFIPDEISNLSQFREIEMQDNELNGPIPSSLGFLENLQKLNLSNNRLYGEVPNRMFNLSLLTVIDLKNNSLSGSLPTNICNNLPNMERIRILNNHINGNIPPSLGTCRKLRRLSLAFNRFFGSIPMEIGNLSKFQTLNLEGNTLIGTIPNEIGNLSALEYLDLAFNSFNGTILKKIWMGFNSFHGILPKSFGNLSIFVEFFGANNCGNKGIIPKEIGNMSNLIQLDIGANEFTRAIPDTLGQLRKLQKLRLCFNKLGGSVRFNLCNLVNLYHLEDNSLTSAIPSTLWTNKDIQILSLAYNLLNGSLASEIGNIKSMRDHIPESFGNPISLQNLDLSKKNLYGVIPKSLERLENLEYFNVSFNELGGEIPNGGPFKNFTSEFFVVVALSLAIVVVYVIRRYRRSIVPLAHSTSLITIKRISYYDVLNAIDNFGEGNLIGKGSIGLVYKGIYSNGMIAAIKAFNLDLEGSNQCFDTECQIFCNIRHRNLVKIITSCSNLDFKALVLEYMPNGNLTKWLFSSNYFLNISQRLEIMIDVASALEYLHHGCQFPIVHCDLKPNNILLDEDKAAHVGEFAISKLLTEDQRISITKTLGIIGYMAPVWVSGLISTMADVDSYGIMMMETFTKKKPTCDMFVGEFTMRKWVFKSFPDAIMQIVAVDLVNPIEENIQAKEICFKSIMGLALECTVNYCLRIKDLTGP